MKKLLLFLLLMPMLAWGQFNPNQPYATVNNACGWNGYLQNGTYYSNAGAALTGLPSCTQPLTAFPNGIQLGQGIGYVDTGVLGVGVGSANGYLQFILQNTNAGATASADYIVNNNQSTATTFYGDFGMNSSGFTGSGALNATNEVYLTSTSADLAIGTTTANSIHVVVNSGTTDAMTVNGSTGQVSIGNLNVTTCTGCGGTTAWSSLTAPTVSNSVTATVDTSQTLLGHFDTSAAAHQALFTVGEDLASTKSAGASNFTMGVQIYTLSGSTETPLCINVQGGLCSASGLNSTFRISSSGGLNYLGLADSVTGTVGSSASITGGASASSNDAGSINLSGGANSSTGSGGSVVLTAGTSTSGTAGTIKAVGAFSVTQQTIDKSYATSTPTTGQTVTIASGQKTAIIIPAGTLATLTVTLPGCTAAYDGSEARFSTTQSITALTVNASSGTVADAPTSLAIGGGNAYICVGSSTTWYRLN